MDTADLKRPAANLLAAKAVRTTGAKRGTKYRLWRREWQRRRLRAESAGEEGVASITLAWRRDEDARP